ncbi:hypothetical protein HY642_06970 [Candidatus Woesearchaeota archaeon]|nr:hypothetical protein [Candidatus Woesearchaeota archaeon]
MVETSISQGSGLVARIRGLFGSAKPTSVETPKQQGQSFFQVLHDRLRKAEDTKTPVCVGLFQVREGMTKVDLIKGLKEYLHQNNGRIPTDYVGNAGHAYVGVIIHNPFYFAQKLLGDYFSHQLHGSEPLVMDASLLPAQKIPAGEVYKTLQNSMSRLEYHPPPRREAS